MKIELEESRTVWWVWESLHQVDVVSLSQNCPWERSLIRQEWAGPVSLPCSTIDWSQCGGSMKETWVVYLMGTTAHNLSSQHFNLDHVHLNFHYLAYKRFLSILWIKEIHLKFHLLFEKERRSFSERWD